MRRVQNTNRRLRGSSLIELMIAIVVLAVGLLGSMALVSVAIGGDYRSKNDSTSTALAEMVAEKISAVPVCKSACGAAATVTVTDCAGNAHVIAVSGVAGGSGATLTANGTIDYSQAQAGVPANYGMLYAVCGQLNGTQGSYDVRWHITPMTSGDEEFVVVAAQLVGSNKGTAIANAPAVNIRTIVGNDGN